MQEQSRALCSSPCGMDPAGAGRSIAGAIPMPLSVSNLPYSLCSSRIDDGGTRERLGIAAPGKVRP